METYDVEADHFKENVLGYLNKDNSFHDVTLATDDYHLMKAHKIILSAGSLYFREILEKANHPHSSEPEP